MNAIATLSKDSVLKLKEFMDRNELTEFFFAKDQGAYFGATLNVPHPEMTERQSYIVYMPGCNPKTCDEWYDTTRQRFGGDDFGVHFDKQLLDLAAELGSYLRLLIREDDILVMYEEQADAHH